MKLTSIILLVAGLATAAASPAQSITLSLKNAPLEKVFSEIKKQTGYTFVYNNNLLAQAKKVDLEVEGAAIKEVLEQCFKDQALTYEIFEKTIVVKPRPNTPAGFNDLPKPPIDIRGRITNENGEPVITSVQVKGTGKGTTTNDNGEFELKGVNDDAILVITGVSIEAIEVKVNGRTNISINVKMTAVQGQDVVVKTNYWETKRRLNPGNISKLTEEDIKTQPVQNVLAAVMARVPGLEIIQQTGVSGGNFIVRIRGINSIANGTNPLFVIDGIPITGSTMAFKESSQQMFFNGTSPINGLNPSDIESVEVLKDADATAIYGSRGANGVILITTKKGKPGGTRFDLNFYSGGGKPASKMELLNTPGYIGMRSQAFTNDNIPPTATSAPDLISWDQNRYTDWQKELIGGTAQTTDLQLSFSGGDANTQFLIGGGYHREGAVFPGENSDQRISTHFTLNNVSNNQKLRTTVSFNYSTNNANFIKRDLTSLALILPPNAPPMFKENGDLNWGSDLDSNTWVYPYIDHPLSYLKTDYEAITKNLLLNSTISYSILPLLSARVNLGLSDISSSTITLTPVSALAPPAAAVSQNESVFSTSDFKNWTVEPQLNWKPKLGAGKFDILIGATFLEQIQNGTAQLGRGFSTEALMKNLKAASTRLVLTNYYSQYRYSAGYARVNYNLKDKYIANATYRRDGSSRFGSDNQVADFGALGLAWIFTKEKFVSENLSFLSFGKLRMSYGLTGNDQLGNYEYMDTYTSSGAYPSQGGVVGLTPVRLANPDFAWETNKKFEAGIEMGFIHDRIETAVSFYKNRSSDQLVGQPLPPTTGFNSIQSNFPAVIDNSGIEIEISSLIIKKKNFNWNTHFNISFPKNKLVEFPDLESSPVYSNTLVVGQPISIVKQYQFLNIDPQTGLYQFKDEDQNGTIDFNDRQTVRFIGQEFFGGLHNSIRFKSLQVDFLFQFVKQSKHNYLSAFSIAPGGGLSNQPSFVIDRAGKSGEGALQNFTVSSPGLESYSLYTGSTEAISDASFIRLKNISVSYDLLGDLIKGTKIKALRAFVQGQNLLTFSNYAGLDPETGSTFLPPLKVLTGGISITL